MAAWRGIAHCGDLLIGGSSLFDSNAVPLRGDRRVQLRIRGGTHASSIRDTARRRLRPSPSKCCRTYGNSGLSVKAHRGRERVACTTSRGPLEGLTLELAHSDKHEYGSVREPADVLRGRAHDGGRVRWNHGALRDVPA